MSRGLPQNVKLNIDKCRDAAIAAVEIYNRPGPRFRTAHYLVLIVIAWTAVFHAIFYSNGRRPWYRKKTSGKGRGVRYQRIDGEPKHWDLAACLAEHFGSENPPERRNLEFLLGLRNKIEHRHLPELDATLYGECQAALLNLEEMLVKHFGARYALEEQLAVSLQFSKLIPAEKKQAAHSLATSEARSVAEYTSKFRGKLPATVLNSMKYSFNVFLLPRVVNRESAADAAVQFVRLDDASPAELVRMQQLNVLIREKHIPIANVDLHKPSEVVRLLKQQVPYVVSMATHTAAWKHFEVRPPKGSRTPEKTVSDYCVYDSVHRDYLFTRSWVDRLVRALSNSDEYTKIVGKAPVAK